MDYYLILIKINCYLWIFVFHELDSAAGGVYEMYGHDHWINQVVVSPQAAGVPETRRTKFLFIQQ